MTPYLIAAVPLFAVACVFWALDAVRSTLRPGTLRRVQVATCQVLVAPAPFALDLVWFGHVLHTGSQSPVVLLVGLGFLPLMIITVRHDACRARQAWRDSQWPGAVTRLRARLRAALRAPSVAPA